MRFSSSVCSSQGASFLFSHSHLDIYSLSLFQFLVVSSYSCTVPVTVYCGDCFPWFPQSRHFGAPSVPLAFVLLSHIKTLFSFLLSLLPIFFYTSHYARITLVISHCRLIFIVFGLKLWYVLK